MIAIIPARGGSKRLPGKNIIDICGKPLIAYSIEAAIISKAFERVIVSTDSEQIAEVACEYGAEPLMRGPELSADTTPTFPVIADVLKRVPTDVFMQLQPTSPFRNEKHIRESVELFNAVSDRFDFLTSVVRANQPSVLIHPLGEDNSLCYFDIDYSTYRSQNYNDYTPNGAIQIAKSDAYLNQKHYYGARSIAYIMERRDSLDIDDDVDYELVKIMMTARIRYELTSCAQQDVIN